MAEHMPLPSTYFADDVYCIAFWNNVVLIDLDGDMTVSRMQKVGEAYRALLAKYPRIVAVCVMRPGTPVASADARAEGARFTKELGEAVARIAMVIESDGIVAQMLRSVVRGISVLARSKAFSLETDVNEALRTLAPLVISSGPRDQVQLDLKDAWHAVRANFRPRQAAAGE